jgi:hypothetical protein
MKDSNYTSLGRMSPYLPDFAERVRQWIDVARGTSDDDDERSGKDGEGYNDFDDMNNAV